MDNSGPRSSAHRHWVTGEISLCDRGKYSVFLMTNENKLDCAVPAQCIHHRIQCVTNDSITALDSSLRQHLPQYVCNCFRHKNLLNCEPGIGTAQFAPSVLRHSTGSTCHCVHAIPLPIARACSLITDAA